jgi:hypothetical protein
MPIEELLAYWQLQLGLRDWRITIEAVRAEKFGDHITLGDCVPGRMKRNARLRLLAEVDHEDGQDDTETILVHELLHIIMPPWLLGQKANRKPRHHRNYTYEQGIDQLARTLVDLSRKGRA